MDGAALFRQTAALVNRAMVPVLRTGPAQRLLGRSFAVLTYRGRRSGREVTLPVNYRRDRETGDVVVVVAAPDVKKWWRNFTGEGSPVTVQMGDTLHQGHAVAARTDRGGVRVRIAVAR